MAREIAWQTLLKIEEGAYANLILEQTLRQKPTLSLVDRNLITELVYGTVKYRQCLDWVLKQLVQKEARLKKGPRLLLRLSLYQLMFLERIPPYAVTNEAVKLAKKHENPGAASLVNGVLRNYLRQPQKIKWPVLAEDPLTYLAVVYSHPRWLLQRWLTRYGVEATEKLCAFNNRPAPVWLRPNTLKCTQSSLMARLAKEGCQIKASQRVANAILLLNSPPLATLPSFQEGLFLVQAENAMLVAPLLQPRPGQTVLDVCAAPGGKATHLAQLMENKGRILAYDLHPHRLALIEENATRLGIEIIETHLGDATKIGQGEQYELILVDAPCSGLGVLNSRPDARWRKKESDLRKLAQLQLAILTNMFSLLAPGGKLVYSTCTLEPEENSEVIAQFQIRFPQMLSFTLEPFLPQGIKEDEKGQKQFLPFRDEGEGFFLAGLQKRG